MLRKLITRFFPSIAEHATAFVLVDAAKHIFGLVFATTGSIFISRVLTTTIAPVRAFKWHLGILFAAGSTWLYILLHEKYSRHRPHFPRLKVDFEIAKYEITYQYHDKYHMMYRKRKKLKALTEGLDFYRDKYLWTGSGPATLTSGMKGQEVVLTVRKSVWQYYEIRFPKSLNKDETVDTEVIWDLQDPEGKAVPFFGATIEEPTSLLELSLLLDPSLDVKEVVCEESSNIGAKKPFRSFVAYRDGADVFSWKEASPELLHHYEIKWSFE